MPRKREGHLYLRGKTWWLKHSVNGAIQRQSLGVKTKAAAERKRDEIMGPIFYADKAKVLRKVERDIQDTDLELKQAEVRQLGRVLIEDGWTAYTELDDEERPALPSEVSQSDYKSNWNSFTKWAKANGIVYFDEVTEEQAKDFVRYLGSTKITNNRRNKVVLTCRRIYKHLGRKHMTGINPFGFYATRPIEKSSRRELSEGELRRVVEKAAPRPQFHALFALGALAGLRLGDACLLKWHDVNLRRNVLIFTPRKTARSGKVVHVPLHPELKNILSQTPPDHRSGYVLPEMAAIYEKSRSEMSRMIQAHLESCDIEVFEEGNTKKNGRCLVGFHSLRHSFVSMCRERGISAAVVQQLVGHGSPAMTRHYTHIGDDLTQAAISQLPYLTGAKPVVLLSAEEKLRAIDMLVAADDSPLAVEIRRILES